MHASGLDTSATITTERYNRTLQCRDRSCGPTTPSPPTPGPPQSCGSSAVMCGQKCNSKDYNENDCSGTSAVAEIAEISGGRNCCTLPLQVSDETTAIYCGTTSQYCGNTKSEDKQRCGSESEQKFALQTPAIDEDMSFSTESLTTSTDNCCEGKPKPCCNEDCIDRLVARDCNLNCTRLRPRETEGKACSSESTGQGAECCSNGITTRRFYRELLRSLGCLCVAVKARGGITCCETATNSSTIPDKTCRSTRAKKQLCCPRRFSKFNGTCTSKMSARCDANASDDCCGSSSCAPKTLRVKSAEITPQDCLSPPPPKLEDGIAASEHVILSVSGMTCVGCKTKLQRSFATIQTVRNLKTSLLLCRAEFDLDRRYENVDSIIRQLQRMTDFKYEELRQDDTYIDVCPLNVEEFVQYNPPKGCISLRTIDKSTVRISYDPSIVGARDIVERGFGNPLQLAPTTTDPSLAADRNHVRHLGLMTMLSTALTIPVLVLAWAPLHPRPIVYGGVSLALATIIQFAVAGSFYPSALKSLVFTKTVEMELLIVISTSAAYVFSVVAFGYLVAGKPLGTGQFFETSTLLVTLIMLGRYLSALARQKAVESVSIRSLQALTAVLCGTKAKDTREIDIRLLQYGDIFQVPPESRIPTDGTVIAGSAEVDESTVTGESLPVAKGPGNVVIAGSVNGLGILTVRLSRLPRDNTISAIANMVDQAKASTPKIQSVADKVAGYIIPAAFVITILVFIIWVAVGLKIQRYGASQAVVEALKYAITVIVVCCPCAIGLAVPMVIVIAGGVAAKHGCIVKNAATIEVAHRASHVIFDKTGTLTQGQLSVVKEEYYGDEQSIATVVHAVVSNVKHPVAIAISKVLESRGIAKQNACNVTTHIGQGVEGVVEGKVVKVGNARWLGLDNHAAVEDSLSTGYTTVCATTDGNFAGVFSLQDFLRIDARDTVMELQRRGIAVSIVSGDDEAPVALIAQQLGITSARSKCTPGDKLQFVEELTNSGKTVIFCGDGTNDAAALAQATIGVHMSESGTDVAQDAADVVLVKSSLSDVLMLVDLSKAAMRRITFNFAWSFVYNICAILFASGALVYVRLPPAFAGLGELVSVLPVIAVALQLRWLKFTKITRRLGEPSDLKCTASVQ